jgi:S1-C subfamily serine protease
MVTRGRTIALTLTLLGLGVWAAVAAADKITLTDGTVLEGTAIKQADGYWIKTTDGETHQISSDQIASVEKSNSSGDSGSGSADSGSSAHSPDYSVAFSRARAAESPVAAVAIWQQFIDSKPAADDLAKAQQQLDQWKKLAASGAEKINGRWVGGEERKAILKQAGELTKEAMDMIQNHQELDSVKKLEEADRIYPNSYAVNFLLGLVALLEKNPDKSMPRFERALKLKPNDPSAMGNMALDLYEKKQYSRAILLMEKSAELQDNALVVLDLDSMIQDVPPAVRNNGEIRSALDADALLVRKYPIPDKMQKHMLAFALPKSATQGDQLVQAPSGMMSGTGFVISADGLILTNRHVIKGAKTTMVVLPGGIQKTAEIVAVDDNQDLALIRIKPDPGQKFLRLATADKPADGADCTVIGYPLIDRLGADVKITRGIVSSGHQQVAEADVVIDAKVNPGNSGGPILDKHGNVMAIVCMKTLSTESEDTYGLGISVGQIRDFLTKQNVKFDRPTNEGDAPLSAEDIAAKAEPATVCILSTL